MSLIRVDLFGRLVGWLIDLGFNVPRTANVKTLNFPDSFVACDLKNGKGNYVSIQGQVYVLP